MLGHEALEIPLLGTMIAEETERFAQDHNLTSTLWYHDAPYWMITENVNRDEVFFRDLQIAVYRTNKGEQLCFMLQGLKWRGRDKGGWASVRPTEWRIQFPLSALLPVDEKTREKLKVLIANAWFFAETLKEIDLVEPTPPSL